MTFKRRELGGTANIVDNEVLSAGWDWNGGGCDGEKAADWGSP